MSSLRRQVYIGGVFFVLDLLNNSLATDYSIGFSIKCKCGSAIQFPTAIKAFRDTVTEAGVVRTSEIAIELHPHFCFDVSERTL